jgi:quercetin dioxygenase-like cupin family protein
MTMSPESRDHSPSTVEELTVLSDRVRVLTAGESTGGRYEVFEVLGTAGGGAPLHSHPWDEDFYVLEGTIQIVSGGKMRTYRVGESLRVPAGTPHGFHAGAAGTKFIAVTSPAGASHLFRALDQAAGKGPLTPEEIVRIASLHRVVVPAKAA